MKKPLLLLALFASLSAYSQVGINTSLSGSTLDVTAKNTTGTSANVDGLLVPRVDRLRAQSMTSVPISTMIYVNNVVTGTQTGTTANVDAVGYYYFNGSAWVKLHNPTNSTFSSVNIYNTDGSLTGNRIVTQGANTLAFTGTAANAFSVDGNTFSVDAANDRVGIGTSTPGMILDVVKPMGTAEDTFVRIINSSPVAVNNTAYLGFNSYNGGGASWGIGSLQKSTSIYDNSFHIMYSSGALYNKRLTIIPNGNVGIGTTAPTSSLSVNGSADKVGGGSWGTFSDSRMKKNLQPYTKGLPEILKINTVTFQYNGKGGYSDDGKTYTGVIAQEIEKVLPGTVTKIKSSDFDDQRKYDSSEITYTLINAIKDQQKLIEAQNKQIKELQADVQILKAKND